MGRIKNKVLKRKTKELLKLHGDQFTTDYSQNKEITRKFTKIGCKKLKNIVSGYMTRLKKKELTTH